MVSIALRPVLQWIQWSLNIIQQHSRRPKSHVITAGLRNIQVAKQNKTKPNLFHALLPSLCVLFTQFYTLLNLLNLFPNVTHFNITCPKNQMETLESQTMPLTFKSYSLYDFCKAVCAKCLSLIYLWPRQGRESVYLPKFVS